MLRAANKTYLKVICTDTKGEKSQPESSYNTSYFTMKLLIATIVDILDIYFSTKQDKSNLYI